MAGFLNRDKVLMMGKLKEEVLQIKKAVITAAGRGARLFPVADTVQKSMLPMVDLDGLVKPVLQIIAEEALESGIEEVCVVCAPGDEQRYRQLFLGLRDSSTAANSGMPWVEKQASKIDFLLTRLHFVEQPEALGYAHAVYCARSVVGSNPFLLLLGDHLYLSQHATRRCAKQLMELAQKEACSIAAVQPTREHRVGQFGTLGGKCLPNYPGVYQIEKILEKPSLSQAELELQTPGLRTGFYLCLFGMHVLSPGIFTILEESLDEKQSSARWLSLTPFLQTLAEREKFLALELEGRRYDLSDRFGITQAQIALGLAGNYRFEFLSLMMETLAESSQSSLGENRREK